MDEPTGAQVFAAGQLAAPWGKEIVVQGLAFESGLTMVRLRIREGRRFTVLDLDAASAAKLAEAIAIAFDKAAHPQAD